MIRHILSVGALGVFVAVGCGDSGGEGGEGGVGGEGASVSSSKSGSGSNSGSTSDASSSSASTSDASTSVTSTNASTSVTSTNASTSVTSTNASTSVSATASTVTTSATGSSSSGMLLCDTGVPDTIDSIACDDCVSCAAMNGCMTEADAFVNDPDAQDFIDCANACTTQACFTQCVNTYPSASSAYFAFFDCVVCAECPNNCDAATNCGAIPTGCDDGTPDTIDSPLCDDCVSCTQTGACQAEWSTFETHPETIDFIDCANNCVTQQCVDQCFVTYPGAGAAYLDVFDCSVCVECPNNCDAATNCP